MHARARQHCFRRRHRHTRESSAVAATLDEWQFLKGWKQTRKQTVVELSRAGGRASAQLVHWSQAQSEARRLLPASGRWTREVDARYSTTAQRRMTTGK